MLLASKDIVFDVAHNTQSSGIASTGNGQTDTITGTQLSVGGNASLTTTQSDITLTASNIAAQGNVSLRAAGDLTIQSGQDILGNTNQSTSKGIGTVVISDTERFAGYNKKNHFDDNAQVSQVASTVGSLGGNVSLTAGGTYTQSASNVVAAKDVDITAASIQLLTANQSSSASQKDDDLGLDPVADRQPEQLRLAEGRRPEDRRVRAHQVATDRSDQQRGRCAQVRRTVGCDAGYGGSGECVRDSESGSEWFIAQRGSRRGLRHKREQLQQQQPELAGSTITGGGNVRLKTTEGDLHIVQGNLKAGDTLSLNSARDLVLEAGNSSNTEQSKPLFSRVISRSEPGPVCRFLGRCCHQPSQGRHISV
ncbi:hemagglutinin repeat-containing protein [Xanthomonas arboricola]|uniref:hemagglutinin repeat-containing protein n=1 Tax=Xanthomonas arboricola TaxID=56448 RepID=UPI001EE7D6B1|nr:hemagglutinin repeat-containing protein [Xanthomonas arboricola]